MSYITHLQCYSCGNHFDSEKIQTFCPDCQSPLLARYDLKTAREKLDRDQFRQRPRGMWRWQELLPVHEQENMINLGEGDTPLLKLTNLGSELGLSHLYVKDEARFSFSSSARIAATSSSVKRNVLRLERLQ